MLLMKKAVICECNRSCSYLVSLVRSLVSVCKEVLAADVAIRLTRLMKASLSRRSLIVSVSDLFGYMKIVLSKCTHGYIIPGTHAL